MKKAICLILAVLLMAACFSGCSQPKESEPANNPTTPPAGGDDKKNADDGAGDDKTKDDGAFSFDGLSGKLVIYSGDDSKVTEDMVALFTEMTGVTCEVLYGGGGELMARIAAEGANPLGDVVVGATAEVVLPYAEYLEPYKVTTDPTLLSQEGDSNGIYSPGGTNILVFMVNTNLLKEEDYPKTWKDLTDEKYFGQIAFSDPSASSSAYLQINVMQQLYGWDFLKEFYKNLDGKILGSSSTVPKATADGEYAIALTIENNAADYLDANAPVAVIYPEDGTMKTQGGAAIIKGAKNLENAKAYIEFTCTQEASKISAKYNRRGARNDVPLSNILPMMSEIKFMDYDYDLAADRETMLKGWNDVLTGR